MRLTSAACSGVKGLVGGGVFSLDARGEAAVEPAEVVLAAEALDDELELKCGGEERPPAFRLVEPAAAPPPLPVEEGV